MAINLAAPSGVGLTGQLIADSVNTAPAGNGLPAWGSDGAPRLTTVVVNGQTVPVSVALELQSTLGGLLNARMTTAQKDALNVTEGFQVYDTDLDAFQFYQAGNWVTFAAAPPGGFVVGPAASTVNGIVRWGNALGTALENSTVLISDTGVVTIPNNAYISNDNGSVNAPSYTFTGDLTTGIFSSGGYILDFAAQGGTQFEVNSANNAVNFLTVVGAATGSMPFFYTQGADADIDIGLLPSGAGGVSVLPAQAGAEGGLVKFWNAAQTHYTGLLGGNAGATVTFTLPTADGANGTVLSTNGAGVLSFVAAGNVSVGGATTQNAIATWNTTGGQLTQNSQVTIGGTGIITSAAAASVIRLSDGSVNAPTYSFNSVNNSGMYYSNAATDSIFFSIAGFQQLGITPVTQGVATNYFVLGGGQAGASGAAAAARVSLTGTDTNVDAYLFCKGTGSLAVASSGGFGKVRVFDNTSANYVGLYGPPTGGSSYNLQYPNATGTVGQTATVASIAGNVTTLQWSNTVQLASGTLSSADLLFMSTDPVELIAAQGANTLIVVLDSWYEIVYGTTQYSGGGGISLQYGDTANAGGTHASGTIAAGFLISSTANHVIAAGGTLTNNLATDTVNLGIFISNTGGDFTAGDSTVKWFISYYVLNLT
jgi:hypothetical protein